MLQRDSIINKNYIIAGNGRVLKAYMFILWLYLFKKYIKLTNNFVRIATYKTTFDKKLNTF